MGFLKGWKTVIGLTIAAAVGVAASFDVSMIPAEDLPEGFDDVVKAIAIIIGWIIGYFGRRNAGREPTPIFSSKPTPGAQTAHDIERLKR